MHINFQDPLFLIPVGIILLTVIALIWALGKLLRGTPAPADLTLTDEFPPLTSDNDLFNASLPEAPLSPIENRPASAPGAAGTNREMASRLDNMTQKLSDMQAVLQRQTAGGPAGTPLTPETIDKLLKIIGNVTQQVDLLQKSLGTPATPGTAAPVPAAVPVPPAPAATHAPAATPTPTPPPAAVPPKPGYNPSAAPAPAIGGKSIGVSGGALSMGRKTMPEAKPGSAPSNPPGTPPGTAPGNQPPGK